MCDLPVRKRVEVPPLELRDGHFSGVGMSELDRFASLLLQFTCKTRHCDSCDTGVPKTSFGDKNKDNKKIQTDI